MNQWKGLYGVEQRRLFQGQLWCPSPLSWTNVRNQCWGSLLSRKPVRKPPFNNFRDENVHQFQIDFETNVMFRTNICLEEMRNNTEAEVCTNNSSCGLVKGHLLFSSAFACASSLLKCQGDLLKTDRKLLTFYVDHQVIVSGVISTARCSRLFLAHDFLRSDLVWSF